MIDVLVQKKHSLSNFCPRPKLAEALSKEEDSHLSWGIDIHKRHLLCHLQPLCETQEPEAEFDPVRLALTKANDSK